MAENGNSKNRRLKRAIDASLERMQPYRMERTEAIAQSVGRHYNSAPGGDKSPIPTNLIRMALEIYGAQLAANAPQVLCTTEDRLRKPFAVTTELAVNELITRINFEREVQLAVQDALYRVGVLAIGYRGGESRDGDDVYGTASTYTKAIDLDDFVVDMCVKKWDEADFMAYRCRVPLEEAKANPRYNKAARNALKRTSKSMVTSDGDRKAQSIGHGDDEDFTEYRDYVELWECWQPHEGKHGRMKTFACEGDGEHMLADDEWDGPPEGPLHILSFGDVPSCLMPSAPMDHWRDLHQLANELFVKLGQQAADQKDLVTYIGEAAQQTERILQARNAQSVKVDVPNGTQHFKLGGPDQVNLVMFLQTMQLFKQFAGNLDVLGGLSAMADTATQEQMMGANASKTVERLMKATYSWMTKASRALAWYAWNDQLYDPRLYKTLSAAGISVPASFSPENRERMGPFALYGIKVQPYSMQYRSPGQQLSTLAQIFQTFIAPYAGVMEQRGISIDFEGLLRLIARLSHFPDLDTLLIFSDPSQQLQEQAQRSAARQIVGGAKPNGKYTRISRKGATAQSQVDALTNRLLGMGQQPEAGEKAFRSVG